MYIYIHSYTYIHIKTDIINNAALSRLTALLFSANVHRS